MAAPSTTRPIRCMVLASGRRMPLGLYVSAWKRCKAIVAAGNGATWMRETPGSEYGGTVTDALRELRSGLADRVNRHTPGYGRGRKWSADWQRNALQTAHAANTPRLIIRWVPVDFRERLAHRIDHE